MKKNVILIDCPWKYVTRSDAGLEKSAEQHYPTMTIEELLVLVPPIVKEVSSSNCAMFFWATWPNIFDQVKIAEACGFKYSGLAWEWRKFNPKTEKYAFGLGYGTRKNLEPCLLFRKGSPYCMDNSIRDFLEADEPIAPSEFMDAPRREHSRKPDEQYELIERLFGGPYFEMFARQSMRPDWTTWGNQTTKFNLTTTEQNA